MREDHIETEIRSRLRSSPEWARRVFNQGLIYLKAACILSRRIYAVVRKPLAVVFFFAAIMVVTVAEGWLLQQIFPAELSTGALFDPYGWMNWISIWLLGLLCNMVLVLLWGLIDGGVQLWLDALREARNPSSRCN